MSNVVNLQQKKKENDEALLFLKSRITTLDKLEDEEKIKALILGVLGGNMFDWGAKEVAILMESTDFSFEEAQAKIPGKQEYYEFCIFFSPPLKKSNKKQELSIIISDRPWLEDCLDEWIVRLKEGPPHRCAAIFVDNSGIDVILGILPFVRDLLQRGTNVRIDK